MENGERQDEDDRGSLLAVMVRDRMEKENISIRGLARKLDLAHSTIVLILNGKIPGLPTMYKFANWLGVPPSTFIDASNPDEDGLVAQIAALIELEPALKQVFSSGIDRVKSGNMSPEQFRSLIRYAAYNFNLIDEGDIEHGTGTSGTKGG